MNAAISQKLDKPKKRGTTRAVKPATAGSYLPGQSGNPTGRPKLPEDIKHVRELARQYTKEAVQALVDVLQDPAGSGGAKVSAANALLDRGWGKAEQPIVGGDDSTSPLRLITKIEIAALK